MRPTRFLPALALAGMAVLCAPAHASVGMAWSTFIGGGGVDIVYAVASDAAGNVYVTGSTASTDYPTTPGAAQRTLGGATDAVVTKLASDGTTVLWSTYLGGSGSETGRAIALDAAGNVYVTGETNSPNFPTTPGAFRTTWSSGQDAFVVKFAPGGGSLVYSTYVGGSWDDYPRGIAVDASNCATIAGFTSSSDFPTTPGVVRPTRSPVFPDGADGFIARLNAAGSGLIYATYLGTDGGTDEIFAVAVDAGGRPTVTGWTVSKNFPTTAGAFSRAYVYDRDGFVTRLTAAGTAYVYSTYVDGSGKDEPFAVTLDAAGNAYVAGRTSSTDFPVYGGPQSTSGGGTYDGFAFELDNTGSALTWSTYLGGSGDDETFGIALGPAGDILLAGLTASTNFPTTSGAVSTSNRGGTDAFLARLAPGGGTLAYSTYLGSAGTDIARGVVVRPNGHVVVVGSSDGSAFVTTNGAYEQTQNGTGSTDGFVSALDTGMSSGGSAGVGDPAVPSGPGAFAFPNPFRSTTVVEWALPGLTAQGVTVLDATGRIVRRTVNGTYQGTVRWTWDGRDDAGRSCAPGIYFARIDGPALSRVVRMVRLN